MYGAGPHLNHFESHVANIFGKPAGIFLPSGSLAQMIALKLHSVGRNAIFACHPKCHILGHQERGFESVLGFSALTVCPPNRVMTALDVETAFGKHWKQPCALVIELPDRELGGQATAWEDLVAIRAFTRSRGVRMHLDGARIWEIQRFYRRSFQEIASLFDSVYVSFYKGLQGTTGAMLLGAESFVTEARVWQTRFGGRIFQAFPIALAAERALNTNVNTFESRWRKMQSVVAALTTAQDEFLASRKDAASVEPVFRFVPPVPQCAMVHMYLLMPSSLAESLRDRVLVATNASVFDRLRGVGKRECYFEWKMGTTNADIETSHFVRAWTNFMEIAQEQRRKEVAESALKQ